MSAAARADSAAVRALGPADPTPVVVVGGYLGAGKTTLINHLLRNAAGRRIAVLVNDFGSTSIDADLIEGASEGVLALAGGCVCCSFGADLVGTLAGVIEREPPPDVVLIECSGVGIPSAVARTARLAPRAVIDGIVVVADAEDVRERAADRYVGEFVRQQIADADLLVVNKTDRVAADELTAIEAWLRSAAAQARLLTAEHARLPADALLGLHGPARAVPGGMPLAGSRGGLRRRGPIAAERRFASATRELAAPLDARALAAALAAQDALVRAKGVVTDLDGRPCTVQVVGRRWSVQPAAGAPARARRRLALIVLAPADAAGVLAAALR